MKKKFLTIISLILVASSCGELVPDVKWAPLVFSAEQNSYVNNVNELGITALNEQIKLEESSLAFSPISMHLALGMISAGANGETQNEILTVLSGENNIDKLSDFHNKIVTGLPYTENNATVLFNNMAVVNEQYAQEWRNAYEKEMKAKYEAKLFNFDFTKEGGEAIDSINKWISAGTKGKIDKLFSSSNFKADALTYHFNSTYFKCGWLAANKFAKSNTEEAAFTKLDKSVIKVQMMCASQMNNILYAENELLQSIKLNLGESFEMTVWLPQADVNIASIVQYDKISAIEYVPKKVDVAIPVMNFESTLDFVDVLKKMGVNKAFESGDFTNMLDPGSDAKINNVLQKTVVKVDEDGCESASVTVIDTNVTSSGEPMGTAVFNADHPFIFSISEKNTGLVITLGCYNG